MGHAGHLGTLGTLWDTWELWDTLGHVIPLGTLGPLLDLTCKAIKNGLKVPISREFFLMYIIEDNPSPVDFSPIHSVGTPRHETQTQEDSVSLLLEMPNGTVLQLSAKSVKNDVVSWLPVPGRTYYNAPFAIALAIQYFRRWHDSRASIS